MNETAKKIRPWLAIPSLCWLLYLGVLLVNGYIHGGNPQFTAIIFFLFPFLVLPFSVWGIVNAIRNFHLSREMIALLVVHVLGILAAGFVVFVLLYVIGWFYLWGSGPH